MANPFRCQREIICLLLGGILGAGAVWTHRQRGQTTQGSPPVLQAAVPSPAQPELPAAEEEIENKLRRQARESTRRQAEQNWETVAAALKSKSGNWAFVQSLLLKLNSTALGQLAAHLASEPFNFRNQRLIGQIYQRWGEVDFPAALAQAQALAAGKRWLCVSEAIRGCASVNPAQICNHLASPVTDDDRYELRIPTHRSSLLGELLVSWGEQDPPAAGAFQLQHPVFAKAFNSVEAVATGWAPQDPQAAASWAARLPAPDRENALRSVFTSWARTDLPASLAYLPSLPTGTDRDALLWGVGTAWGTQDPLAAARWAEAQGNEAATAVLNSWSQQDPPGAANWATQQTAIKFDPTIWDAATTNYVLSDSDGALQWINRLPEGSRRDGAIAAYSRAVGTDKDILTALGLAQTMSKSSSRETITASILNSWLLSQPTAAKQWISQANLPPAVTDHLKNP